VPEVQAVGVAVTKESPTNASSSPAATAASGVLYDPAQVEARWQESWAREHVVAVPPREDPRQPAYVLAPSARPLRGARMGHLRGYVIADVCARFMRARGRAVLFPVGCESGGRPAVELERVRGQVERLGCSCAWGRSSTSSDLERFRWTQRLFLLMLEHDLVYRGEAHWSIRVAPQLRSIEHELDHLSGWSSTAVDSQRSVLGRVDGVEVDANTFDGAALTVFTDHADAIADAEFIAISPAHPDVDRWSSGSHLATVAGVAGLLPIVVSSLVDARYGPTAVLGIPKADPADRAIVQELPAPSGATWRASKSSAVPTPAVRYRAHDLPISHAGAFGAPIPLVRCTACGTVPVPREDLPVCVPDDLEIAGGEKSSLAARDDFVECACPRCGGPARREADRFDGRFDEMWTWLAFCVPSEHRSSKMLSDEAHRRWLPAEQVVFGAEEARRVFEQRVMAKVLQDLGELPELSSREPFAKALVYETVTAEGSLDPEALIEDTGADALRLVLLYAAAPERVLNWNDGALRYCRGFLDKLYAYAEPRLREWGPSGDRRARIETGARLRRRLANWCSVALTKTTGHLERLEMHRAADDVIRLLARIQDFEQRMLERRQGELEDEDREAIVAALLLLVQLLAPITPHIAEELWSVAGNATLLSDAPWPERQTRAPGLDAALANGGDA
jgi:leucyl-tRNA synthetase